MSVYSIIVIFIYLITGTLVAWLIELKTKKRTAKQVLITILFWPLLLLGFISYCIDTVLIDILEDITKRD